MRVYFTSMPLPMPSVVISILACCSMLAQSSFAAPIFTATTETLGTYHPVTADSLVSTGSTWTLAYNLFWLTELVGPFTLSDGEMYFEPTATITTSVEVPTSTSTTAVGGGTTTSTTSVTSTTSTSSVGQGETSTSITAVGRI